MEEQQVLSRLLDLAEQVGIEVRVLALGGEGGGLCRVRQKWVLFVDDQAGLADQIETTAQALAGREELENCFVPPAIRELLEKHL